MHKLSAASFCIFAFLSTPVTLFAQTTDTLQVALRSAALCKPLKFDAKDVFKLFGINIPNIPGLDTKIGWDEDNHTVKTFTVDGSKIVHADLEIGCQPSDQGALLKAVGKKGSDVRLVENVTCQGTAASDNSVTDLTCTTSGAGAQFLNQIVDLNGQLKPIFKTALTP